MTSRTPVIGICPVGMTDDGNVWCRQNYFDFLLAGGAFAVMLPAHPDPAAACAALERLDGLLLPGGADVAPERFASTKPELCGEPDLRRDGTEFAAFETARRLGMPVFGICRGIQVINVALGGTLIEDVNQVTGSKTNHRRLPAPAPVTFHHVDVVPGSVLAQVAGSTHFEVNSYHHQCLGRVADGLEVLAHCSEDGIVEAVRGTEGAFLLGVQWHPERSVDDAHPQSVRLAKHFAQAAREYAKER